MRPDEWDGTLTPEQVRFHAEAMRNDAALFAAIARTECTACYTGEPDDEHSCDQAQQQA